MIKYYLNLLIIICTSIGLYAQSDSLRGVWNNKAEADSNKAKALQNLLWKDYIFSKSDSALILNKMLLDFCVEKGLKGLEIKAIINNGVVNYLTGNFMEALDYYNEALKPALEHGSKPTLARIYNNIALIHMEQGLYESALENYYKTLGIAEHLNDRELIAMATGNIGLLYQQQNNVEQAIKYHTKSFQLSDGLADQRGAANSLLNLGVIYKEKGEHEKAISYYMKARDKFVEAKEVVGEASCYNNLGTLYFDMNRNGLGNRDTLLARSLYYHGLAYAIRQQTSNIKGAIGSKINLANIYMEKKVFRRAISLSSEALKEAQKQGLVYEMRNAASLLSDCYRKLGNYKDALEMYELHISMRDSLMNERNIEETARYKFQYEFEKKALADSLENANRLENMSLNYQISMGRKQRERNIYISLSIVALLLLTIVYQRKVNRNKLMLKEKEAQYQDELMVATIASQEHERRRIARDLHDEVGAMLSTIKLNLGGVNMKLKKMGVEGDLTADTKSLLDDTIQNVRQISKDLLPPTLEEFGLAQALSELCEKVESASGIKIIAQIKDISPRLKPDQELALYRVVQEMINNALKHAEASEFTLELKQENNSVNLRFADNGKGFDLYSIKNSKAGMRGLGLKNLENRAKAASGIIDFQSSPGKGTQISISLNHPI
jgi:signal transduction histidine kinase